MKKRFLLSIALSTLGYLNSNAQVGVGTFTPDSSAQLDVSATNKGLLVPRLALTSTTLSAPIVGTPAQSLYIFNTSTTGDVTPGFYYWNESKWNRVLNPSDIANLETLTVFALEADGHNLKYTDEEGTVTTIDLETVIDNFETVTSLVYNGTANTLTYKDEDNVDHLIDIATLVKKNETVTTLVDNNDGTFTYTNEAGAPVSYDVNAQIGRNAWLLAGNPTTDPTVDFIGTTDAQPLKIKTNSTERIVIQATGNVGVNVSQPTSSFATSGSESKSITVKTSSYTATDQDHTIVFRNTSPETLTLPDPSTCIGRIYFIVNNGTADLTLSPAIEMANGVNTNKLGTGSGVNGNVVFGNRIKVQSEGTSYIIIQ